MVVEELVLSLIHIYDKQVAYYDEQDSLLGRTLSCVVTLTQDDSQSQPYTFMIQLQGTIKVVDSNG